jgi:hypothetical protein
MLKKLALVSIGIVVLLLIPGGPFGLVRSLSTSGSALGSPGSALSDALAAVPSGAAGGGSTAAGPAPPSTDTASISIADLATARDLPSAFWGVNVAAAQSFTSTDAANIAATPVNYLRFPGGILGEEYNYTSGVMTNVNGGGTSVASTSIQQFISACRSIGCKAILQLPAEIDQPQTAAYYASYVVNTLHFKPAYFEVGNAVQSWSHFGQSWSAWKTKSSTHVDALSFALELQKYVKAIRAVVPNSKIVALGMALGRPNNDRDYITDVAIYDGKNISGVSVHSYVMGSAPAHPTGAELLANLNGEYSLTNGVDAARGYLKTGCSSCDLKVFVTEANAAEVDNYTKILATFPGTVYVAADTVQALNLRVKNLDWFAYDSHYTGAWLEGKTFGPQYTLMSQMMSHLGGKTLVSTISGSSTLYSAATYGTGGLALLLVNANLTHSVSLNLGQSGILVGALVGQEQWVNGSNGPTNSSFTLATSVKLPELSITILSVGLSGLRPAESPGLSAAGGVSSVEASPGAEPNSVPSTPSALPANPLGTSAWFLPGKD